jgi:prepilin-type N-terminal cleavage/methylation domain-containing protein
MTPVTKREKQRGFTLIEVISVILIAAVVGTLLFQYFGASFIQSPLPVKRLVETFRLQRTLENMTADYDGSNKTSAYLDTALRPKIGGEGSDQNNGYGQYHVVHNRFIKFVGQAEAAASGGDPKNILKVTIRNGEDETLTVFFVSS